MNYDKLIKDRLGDKVLSLNSLSNLIRVQFKSDVVKNNTVYNKSEGFVTIDSNEYPTFVQFVDIYERSYLVEYFYDIRYLYEQYDKPRISMVSLTIDDDVYEKQYFYANGQYSGMYISINGEPLTTDHHYGLGVLDNPNLVEGLKPL